MLHIDSRIVKRNFVSVSWISFYFSHRACAATNVVLFTVSDHFSDSPYCCLSKSQAVMWSISVCTIQYKSSHFCLYI